CSGDRAAGDRTIFDDDVLVHVFRQDRRVLPRGDVGDAASRNTDQDGDLPVRIVLSPGGTGHSQGGGEAAPHQGMPNHSPLSANDFGALGAPHAEIRARGSPARYSGLILAARITWAHFPVSSAISVPKSAGEPASVVPPRAASCPLIFGSASSALISLLSVSTISAGVFLGAPIPNQAPTS